MAVFSGPEIVNSSLVVHLDATNAKSYDSNENLVLQSSAIGLTPTYSVTGIATLNTTATVAPNGLFEATLVDNDGNTATNYVYGNQPILSPNTIYTYSIHIKQGTKQDYQITIDENGFGGKRYFAGFNYATEIITTGITGPANDGVLLGSSVTKLPNGWYRLSLTFKTSTTTVSNIIDFINRFGNTGSNYVWGRQLEFGLTATTYYPTITTAKTRGTVFKDLSGNNNNFTLGNGPTYSPSNKGSILFDGVNDNCISNTVLSISTSTVTVSCWVKVAAHGNFHDFANNNWVNSGWLLYSYSTGWVFGVGQTGAQYGAVVSHNNSTAWTQLTGTYDGTSVKLYVNGVLGATTALVGATLNVGYPIAIYQGTRPSVCNISNTLIYNRALTALEVRQNFEATRTRYNI
jgi:hypothetical protein